MKGMAAFGLLLLTACGSSGEDPGQSRAVAEPGLECATDGASDYGTGCTVERDGAVLTIRSPTGSFRRLRVTNGRIAAADGAEPARLLGDDGKRVNVAVGGDRYLIPREALR